MSYEHCDIHDEDATNGCAVCMAEALFEKCLEGGRRALETFRRLTGDACPDDYEEPMMHCCALIFLDGLAAHEGALEPDTITVVRQRLEAILLPGARPGNPNQKVGQA